MTTIKITMVVDDGFDDEADDTGLTAQAHDRIVNFLLSYGTDIDIEQVETV